MASLFAKARTIVMGNLHDLLDKAIDLNSAGAVKQYVRDLENAKNDLETEVAVARGNVTTLTREVGALKGKMQVQSSNIDLILSDGNPGNDHIAETMDAELQDMEEDMGAKNEELDAANMTVTSLSAVATKLSEKHRTMVNQLSRLTTMERAASAKERAAAAIRTHGSALGDTPSVDNLARRSQARSDAADATLESAMGSVASSGADEVAKLKTTSRLADRKARLGVGGTATGEMNK